MTPEQGPDSCLKAYQFMFDHLFFAKNLQQLEEQLQELVELENQVSH